MKIDFFTREIVMVLDAEFSTYKRGMSAAKINAYFDDLKFLPEQNWEPVLKHILIECKTYPKPKDIISLYKSFNPQAFPKPQGEYVDQWQKQRNEHDDVIEESVQKSLLNYDVVHQQSIREGWNYRLKDVLRQIAELQMHAINSKVTYGYSVYLLPIRFDAIASEVRECIDAIYSQVDNQHLAKPQPTLTKEQLKVIRYNWKCEQKNIQIPDDEIEDDNKKEKTGHISETLNKMIR